MVQYNLNYGSIVNKFYSHLKYSKIFIIKTMNTKAFTFNSSKFSRFFSIGMINYLIKSEEIP